MPLIYVVSVQLCVLTFLIIHEIVSDLAVWQSSSPGNRMTLLQKGRGHHVRVLLGRLVPLLLHHERLLQGHLDQRALIPFAQAVWDRARGEVNEHPTLLLSTLPTPVLEA